jgi:hypothetical protein
MQNLDEIQAGLFFLLDEAGNVVPVHDNGSGEPLVVQWAMQLTDDMRRVAYDAGNGWEVSTVFLGVDHMRMLQHHRTPMVFETLVHVRQRKRTDMAGYVRRTATRDAAMLVHHEAVNMARTGVPPCEWDRW